MVIEENISDVRDDPFGLNIWWNLNILRDTLREVDNLMEYFFAKRIIAP